MIADRELRAIGLSTSAVVLYGPLLRVLTTAALLVVLAGQSIVCWKIAVSTLQVRAMADFGVFYASARRVLDGEPPYELSTAADGRPTRPPNLTPPHFIAALTPLAMLPPLAAAAIWAAASVASALVALALIFRGAGIAPTPRSILITATAIVAAAPTGALLFAGQITWLLWGPLTLAWTLARRGRWPAAAAILGVLASVKPFLLLFAPALLVIRAWRESAVVFATAMGCLLAGLAALGGDAFAGWVDALRSVSWAGHVWNGAARGFVDRALAGATHSAWPLAPVIVAPALVTAIWLASATAIAIATARALASVRRSTTLDVDRFFAIALTASFLLSPLAWLYYDFLLAAPFVALAATPAWRTRGRLVALTTAAISLTLTPGMLGAGQPNGVATITIGSLYFWAVFGLWLAVVGFRQPRSAPARQ